MWTTEAVSQGTDSAIAAIEAGECIDTGDEGQKTINAAISPSWILSVFDVNPTILPVFEPKLSSLGDGSHRRQGNW